MDEQGMGRRNFLQAAACAPLATGGADQPAGGEPVLLTVCGDIARPNRGPSDGKLDQLLHKHDLAFKAARTFTHGELAALPQQRIAPTLEYDGCPHVLRGPSLLAVLKTAGATVSDATPVFLQAFDGYRVESTGRELREQGFIVALELDGAPLPLGGLGPLWAVFDADRWPAVAGKPLAERFAHCPWGLYAVRVGR